MDLIKMKVITTNEAVEAVSNILMEQDAQGIQIEEGNNKVNVITYFPSSTDILKIQKLVTAKTQALKEYGLNPGEAKVVINEVKQSDWANKWESYYHVERVTRFLTVVPAWEDYQPETGDQILIKLDPKMAFGTGTHPTTKMSMQALENVIRGGEKVFDVGTGSGVLSIVAQKLGAGKIRAWDNDPVAIESAAKNLELNDDVHDIDLGVNSLLDGISDKADVVVANMLAEVLLPLIPQVNERLNKSGKLILAGIYADKLNDIKLALDEQNFVIEQISELGNWRSIVAIKGE
ncbi:50S ribosomal protein L11 methyltransferase [Fructilactobacillus vespulae]|uniref:50S ribosomal protein L11 methyltransferase n=1 Tax=Fructilactobacillus vespulae TaxID=1249630 RepID=UPI0039B394F2